MKNCVLTDRGASPHMVKQKEYFLTYEIFPASRQIRIGNSKVIVAYSQRTVNVEMFIK